MEDGQFAKINADVIIRTGGESGYQAEPFICKLNSFEIVTIEEFLENNYVPKYQVSISYPPGFEILRNDETIYYWQIYKDGYRLYADGTFVREFSGDTADEQLKSYLAD